MSGNGTIKRRGFFSSLFGFLAAPIAFMRAQSLADTPVVCAVDDSVNVELTEIRFPDGTTLCYPSKFNMPGMTEEEFPETQITIVEGKP